MLNAMRTTLNAMRDAARIQDANTRREYKTATRDANTRRTVQSREPEKSLVGSTDENASPVMVASCPVSRVKRPMSRDMRQVSRVSI
jgi:hypothetical protein